MRNIICLGLFLLFLSSAHSQINDARFLSRVGITDSLYSNTLEEHREIYVQLPDSYTLNPNQNYPVVYILDGEVFLPTLVNVHEFYFGGYMPEMVLVGISNSENRTRDLTPSKITTKFGRPFNQETGGAADFHSFLENELIPFVESKYPVTGYRTLIGHSYGGLFAVYSMINNPDLFQNYLAIDPSLDWDKQIIINKAEQMLSYQDYKGKALYISLSGQLHMQDPGVTIENVMQDESDFTLFARSNIMFKDLLNRHHENGLRLSWEFFLNELHGTIPFPSIRNGLVSLFEWFQMENTDRVNSPNTPKEELKSIIEYRARKLQGHFGYAVPPYPEDLLNVLGYMSMDMEQPDKARMFFEFAIEYYPNSANAFDSMAEYYERNEDYSNAIISMTKAYELSGNDFHKQRIDQLKKKVKRD